MIGYWLLTKGILIKVGEIEDEYLKNPKKYKK